MTADVGAPITGVVWKVLISTGERGALEQPVILLESMKMEVPAVAPVAGVVDAILVKPGEAVEEGDKLAVIG